jgi:hypothetical protein
MTPGYSYICSIASGQTSPVDETPTVDKVASRSDREADYF